MAKQKVLVNGKEIIVDPQAPGVSVVEVEPGVYSVLMDGRSFEARWTDGSVEVDGVAYLTELIDPRAHRPKSTSSDPGGRQSLHSPMPGRIVRVLVDEGQTVEAGQGILVMEAMKMQNELKAPRSGVVSMKVGEGAAVSSGQLLAVIE